MFSYGPAPGRRWPHRWPSAAIAMVVTTALMSICSGTRAAAAYCPWVGLRGSPSAGSRPFVGKFSTCRTSTSSSRSRSNSVLCLAPPPHRLPTITAVDFLQCVQPQRSSPVAQSELIAGENERQSAGGARPLTIALIERTRVQPRGPRRDDGTTRKAGTQRATVCCNPELDAGPEEHCCLA